MGLSAVSGTVSSPVSLREARAPLDSGDGTFQDPGLSSRISAMRGGWWVEKHPSFPADLTGNSGADIVGFGDAGMWTALTTATGLLKHHGLCSRTSVMTTL